MTTPKDGQPEESSARRSGGTFKGRWGGAEKELIKSAADKLGADYTDFMAAIALEKAAEVLGGRDAEIALELSKRRKKKMIGLL